jgi:hypothetical protein
MRFSLDCVAEKSKSEGKPRYRKRLVWWGDLLPRFSEISLVNLCFSPWRWAILCFIRTREAFRKFLKSATLWLIFGTLNG